MTKILSNIFQEKTNILRSKYNDLFHLNCKVEYLYQQFYVTEWSLFIKYKSLEEYFSDENKPIFSSRNGNTFEELLNFIKKLEVEKEVEDGKKI